MAFSGGTGTEADPYRITNIDQLQEMKDYLTSSFILTNDIDASETEEWNSDGSIYNGFAPIGNSTTPFVGTFDGGGYKISGLYINRQDTSEEAALFGSIRTNTSYNKVTNGTFTGSATGWTITGSGIVWVDGTGTADYIQISPNTPMGNIAQNCSVVAGEFYILSYVISSYSAGSLTATCGGVTLSTNSSNGTKTETFVATSSGNLIFQPTDNANMRLDTVVLTRVLTFKDVRLLDVNIKGYYAAGFSSGIYGTVSDSHTLFENIKVTGRIEGIYDVGGFSQHVYSGCTFTDCSVEAALIHTTSADGKDFGGFVANLYGGTFDGCTTSGAMSATGDFSGSSAVSKSIGGFVAIVESGSTSTFINCRSDMSIIVNTDSSGTNVWSAIGGFIGYPSGTANCTLCGATGSITFSGNAGTAIGGFSGIGASCTKCYAKGSIYAPNATSGTLRCGGFSGTGSVCSDCYAWGDVCKTGISSLADSSLGGFCGTSASNITDCYCVGFVNQDATYHGGFIGNKSAGTTTTCYWDTESSGESVGKMGSGSAAGITGLTTEQAILQASYTGFDFTSTWEDGTVTAFEQEGTNITLWASKTNDYDNFEIGDKDDDAIENEIPTQNEIRFVAALEALIIGTAGDEWKMGSNKLSTPITPTNITIKQQSEYGSSLIQPVKINSAILFVDFVARKLREAAYDVNAEKFLSPDLTVLAEHITKTGITSIARQKNPDSILWCTLTDGTLLSFAYERDQNVLAWAKHPLGGDGFCQSVCVLPGATEDVVYISVYHTRVGSAVTRDGETVTRDGETVYWGESENVFIEKIMPRSFDTISDCFFVDCGITATRATETSIITGLGHIEGETVKLLVDGVEADEDVVENGQVTVSFAGVASTTWTTAHVGLAYTSLLQPLRIVVGDSHGAITKVPELNASFLDTGAAFYGNDDSDVKAIDFTQIGLINTSDITGLYTGQTKLTMPGGFSVESPIFITSDKPLPCTVRALMVRIEKTGR